MSVAQRIVVESPAVARIVYGRLAPAMQLLRLRVSVVAPTEVLVHAPDIAHPDAWDAAALALASALLGGSAVHAVLHCATMSAAQRRVHTRSICRLLSLEPCDDGVCTRAWREAGIYICRTPCHIMPSPTTENS